MKINANGQPMLQQAKALSNDPLKAVSLARFAIPFCHSNPQTGFCLSIFFHVDDETAANPAPPMVGNAQKLTPLQ